MEKISQGLKIQESLPNYHALDGNRIVCEISFGLNLKICPGSLITNLNMQI